MNAAQFLRNLIAAMPYAIHTVLTDNGIQFTNRARNTYAFHHIFDRICDENGIEHRLTRIKHPWTNGQVERMNRTIKEATVKRFPHDDHGQLRRYLQDFIDAYTFGRRLKTLRVHVQAVDFRAGSIHHRPNPSNAGTEHLEQIRLIPGHILQP